MSTTFKAVSRPRVKSIKQIEVLVAIGAFLMLGFIGLVGISVWNARQWLPLRDTHAVNSTLTATSKIAGALGGKTEPKRTWARNKRGLDEADQAVEFKDLPAFCGGGELASAALCCQTACSRAPGEADSSASKTDAGVSSVFPTPDDRPAGTTRNKRGLDEADSKMDAVVSPAFPTPDDLPAGATGVQIRAQFGEPTARVIETRDGGVFELYYYFNPEHTQLTVARLKAGVIVSGENTVP
jgi:hypothetical protein